MAVIGYRSLNDKDRYIGESHPNAKLTDEDVEFLRDMHERLGLSIRFISRATGVPRRTVRCILNYQSRAQVASRVIKYVRPA